MDDDQVLCKSHLFSSTFHSSCTFLTRYDSCKISAAARFMQSLSLGGVTFLFWESQEAINKFSSYTGQRYAPVIERLPIYQLGRQKRVFAISRSVVALNFASKQNAVRTM